MHSSANFRTVLYESQNAKPLVAEPETDFNAKLPLYSRSFKIIYFGVTEEALGGLIDYC